MGEETNQEEAKPEVKKEEENKEETKTPSPLILYVSLHCVGCAKKIERSIMKIRGVEGVVVNMAQNQVTIKGVVEPQDVCTMIMKKTNRVVTILSSPLPEADGESLADEVVASQDSELGSVELTVNLHCEACADQLEKKILQMKGVRTAETELRSGKVTVTGTMDADKLVDYVYRRTRKQAKIVPQPEPEKPPEEPKPEEKKEEEDQKPGEEKKGAAEEAAAQKEEDTGKEEEKVEESKKDEEERMMISEEEQRMNKMMFYYPEPLYVIERIPPPQLFSDENPNACCIS